MSDDDGVQSGRVGREIVRSPVTLCVATGAHHSRQRSGFALDEQPLDPAARKKVDVLQKFPGRRPRLRRVDHRTGPKYSDPTFGQPDELFGQEYWPARTDLGRVQDSARKDNEVGVFGQRGVEDRFRGRKRCFKEQVRQMVGHLRHAHQRPFQMKVAGMNEPKWANRHGHLRARECIAGGLARRVSR